MAELPITSLLLCASASLIIVSCEILRPLTSVPTHIAAVSPTPSEPLSPTPQAARPTPTATPAKHAIPAGILAFVSSRGGATGIFLIGLPSQSIQPLLVDTENALSSPAWSPDGTLVAYASNMHRGVYDPLDIFVMHSDGTGATRLSSSKKDADHPSWSPDGRRMAYDVGSPWASRVVVVAATGGFEFEIAGSPFAGRPVFSPRADRIAFLCGDAYPVLAICVYDIRSGGTSRVPGVTATPDGIAWAPATEELAYTDSSDCKLHVLVLSSFETRALTDGPGCERTPAWSPNGKYIAFRSDRDDPLGDLYIVASEGGDPIAIGMNPGYDSSPAWKP